MKRLVSLLVVVFMTLSGVSAHAGMLVSTIDQDHVSLMAMDHDDHKLTAMDHGDDPMEDHSRHQLGCGLGHCAIACGFLLQHFAFSAPENIGSLTMTCTERLLVGGTTSFEPPPPKV